MFAGFNREIRNSYRLQGIRIRYTAAGVEMAAEQAGAHVAPNLDFTINARGPSGLVRTGGPMRIGTGGRIEFEDGNGWISRTIGTNTLGFSPSGNAAAMSLAASWLFTPADVRVGVETGAQATRTIGARDRANNTGAGHHIRLVGGAGQTTSTGDAGGRAEVVGGAAGGTGNNAGGEVWIGGGAPTGTGARGEVRLGWDGTNESRVRFRNTKLAIRGYSESTGAPTTTQLPADGDCGIHKNTSSGTVFLAFNDGGTIRSVALT